MANKSKAAKPLKIDTKTFLKLMSKRDALAKIIARNEKKLGKVDSQLASFAVWLQSLTGTK